MAGGLVPHLKEVLSLTDKELYFITSNSGYHHFKTHLLETLEETKDEAFPYYYPCEKAYRLFRIVRDNI